MATTDAKPGFRLPWSADRAAGAPSDPPADAVEPVSGPVGAPDQNPSAAADDPRSPQETESPAMIDAAPAATTTEAAVDAERAGAPAEPIAAPTPPSPARKPNKFMADLTKAMQAAAEAARTDTLERLAADAKAHVEAIHADSATEATELRKQADDDVAAVREWSKAEIARIREETDERITHRKERLEREIEQHAAEIEARIERVQARVAAFETEMAAFFERLLAEQDPTRFAAMAEALPEPPPFDGDAPVAVIPEVVAPEPEPQVEAAVESDGTDAPTSVEAEATVEPGVAPTESQPTGDASAWPASDPEIIDVQPAAQGEADLFSIGADEPAAGDDPRLSALGLTPDFAAAEAEAAAFTADAGDGSDEPIAEIGDDAIAARLAGIVPETEGEAESATTTLVVTGLVSVASIAGFKRHLSRAGGVRSVGVSSGPEGEFVYLVQHDPGVDLRDIVSALPGFGARVTGESDGTVTVTAQDPESGN
ncbi:MAG TPA: hypothetical protein VFO05_07755 [Candidatus Limnocylindrales bacterium]|nr:hypothetical protein [Candidatus Limnocylindrales bacterium]